MLPQPSGLIVWLALIYTLCIAQSINNGTRNDLICAPHGICERCPDAALHQPYCQPFGNRRLVHCRNTTSTTPDSSSASASTDDDTDTEISSPNSRPHYAQRPPSLLDSSPPVSEGSDEVEKDIMLAWESCGRVVSTERADFFEFVTVNLLFACVSVGSVVWRSRRMRLLHARQLAARIGMVGRRR